MIDRAPLEAFFDVEALDPEPPEAISADDGVVRGNFPAGSYALWVARGYEPADVDYRITFGPEGKGR